MLKPIYPTSGHWITFRGGYLNLADRKLLLDIIELMTEESYSFRSKENVEKLRTVVNSQLAALMDKVRKAEKGQVSP